MPDKAMNLIIQKERNYSNCYKTIMLKSPTIVRMFRLRNKNWLKRRWLDFRNGHGIYLIFFLTLAQFVIIQYKSSVMDDVVIISSKSCVQVF